MYMESSELCNCHAPDKSFQIRVRKKLLRLESRWRRAIWQGNEGLGETYICSRLIVEMFENGDEM